MLDLLVPDVRCTAMEKGGLFLKVRIWVGSRNGSALMPIVERGICVLFSGLLLGGPRHSTRGVVDCFAGEVFDFVCVCGEAQDTTGVGGGRGAWFVRCVRLLCEDNLLALF